MSHSNLSELEDSLRRCKALRSFCISEFAKVYSTVDKTVFSEFCISERSGFSCHLALRPRCGHFSTLSFAILPPALAPKREMIAPSSTYDTCKHKPREDFKAWCSTCVWVFRVNSTSLSWSSQFKMLATSQENKNQSLLLGFSLA